MNRTSTRNAPRHTLNKPNSSMTRSSSVGVINQSDSESDLSHQQSGSMRSMRVMRPTISSQNKAISSVNKSNMPLRRRGMSGAYSSMTLNQAGDNEDSSSEEGKNNHTGRQRSASQDRSNTSLAGSHRRVGTSLGRSGSERDLSHSQRMSQRPVNKIQRSISGLIRSSIDASPMDRDNALDIAGAPLSQQLISSITEQLMIVADNVVQLRNCLTVESIDQSMEMNKPDISMLLNGLQGAVGEAQKTLRLVNSASENNIASKRKHL